MGAQVEAMRVSMMKKELDERGVDYRGLLEKSEFVDLLVDARARGITAPSATSGDDGADGGEEKEGAGAPSGSKEDENGFDPSYKEVKVISFFSKTPLYGGSIAVTTYYLC